MGLIVIRYWTFSFPVKRDMALLFHVIRYWSTVVIRYWRFLFPVKRYQTFLFSVKRYQTFLFSVKRYRTSLTGVSSKQFESYIYDCKTSLPKVNLKIFA